MFYLKKNKNRFVQPCAVDGRIGSESRVVGRRSAFRQRPSGPSDGVSRITVSGRRHRRLSAQKATGGATVHPTGNAALLARLCALHRRLHRARRPPGGHAVNQQQLPQLPAPGRSHQSRKLSIHQVRNFFRFKRPTIGPTDPHVTMLSVKLTRDFLVNKSHRGDLTDNAYNSPLNGPKTHLAVSRLGLTWDERQISAGRHSNGQETH